nr:signal peptidase II [Ferrimicrobium acidiphilum]
MEPVRRPRLARSNWVWPLTACLATVGVDLGTTAWATTYLRSQEPSFMGGVIRLHIVYNTGAAFGLGQGHEWLVEVGEVLILTLLGFLVRNTTPFTRVGVALAIGGGAGNLLVRLTGPDGPFNSPVVDWIHLSFYPATFNLADVALRIGVVVAILGFIFDNRHQRVSERLRVLGSDREGGE